MSFRRVEVNVSSCQPLLSFVVRASTLLNQHHVCFAYARVKYLHVAACVLRLGTTFDNSLVVEIWSSTFVVAFLAGCCTRSVRYRVPIMMCSASEIG